MRDQVAGPEEGYGVSRAPVLMDFYDAARQRYNNWSETPMVIIPGPGPGPRETRATDRWKMARWIADFRGFFSGL